MSLLWVSLAWVSSPESDQVSVNDEIEFLPLQSWKSSLLRPPTPLRYHMPRDHAWISNWPFNTSLEMKKKYLKDKQFFFKSSKKKKNLLPKRVGRQILGERPSIFYFGSLAWPVWKCKVKHKSKHLSTESDQLRYLDLSQIRSQNLHAYKHKRVRVVTASLIRHLWLSTLSA